MPFRVIGAIWLVKKLSQITVMTCVSLLLNCWFKRIINENSKMETGSSASIGSRMNSRYLVVTISTIIKSAKMAMVVNDH